MSAQIVLTHALNDIDAALVDALGRHGVTISSDTASRVLNDVLADDRFTHRLTTVLHETVGSPFCDGDFGGKSCDDRALAVVRHLMWR